jgi:hypothetical protein
VLLPLPASLRLLLLGVRVLMAWCIAPMDWERVAQAKAGGTCEQHASCHGISMCMGAIQLYHALGAQLCAVPTEYKLTCAVVVVELVAGDALSSGRLRLGVHEAMAAEGATRAAGTGGKCSAATGL